jgi:hypothetical protein
MLAKLNKETGKIISANLSSAFFQLDLSLLGHLRNLSHDYDYLGRHHHPILGLMSLFSKSFSLLRDGSVTSFSSCLISFISGTSGRISCSPGEAVCSVGYEVVMSARNKDE